MIKKLNSKISNNSTSNQKLTTEELENFKRVYESFNKRLLDLGAVELDIKAFKMQLEEAEKVKEELISVLQSLDEEKAKLSVDLGDKYGNKQVDLETGELR